MKKGVINRPLCTNNVTMNKQCPIMHQAVTKSTHKCKQEHQRGRKKIIFKWSFWYFKYSSMKTLQKLISTEKLWSLVDGSVEWQLVGWWSFIRWKGSCCVGARRSLVRKVVGELMKRLSVSHSSVVFVICALWIRILF